jgi:serine O-acetyltransferase
MKEVGILIVSDWNRYLELHNKKITMFLFLCVFFHNTGMIFSIMYRIEHYLLYRANIFGKIVGIILFPFYYFMTFYFFDFDIPPSVTFGKGLYVHNRGITFVNGVTCGNWTSIFGPVTLGKRGLKNSDQGVPLLGNNVNVYAGARVIGGIKIGNNVEIGANAVVLKSFPSNVIVAGVPAKIVKRLK